MEAKVMEPEKCFEWGWIPFTEIPQPRFEPLQALIDSGFHPLDDREGLDVRIVDVVRPARPSVDVGAGSRALE